MQSFLVAYCKARLREEGVTHLQTGETWNQSDIMYFCKKGMPPKEIHKDFRLWTKFPSYSTVEKWAAEFERGRESVEVLDGLATQKIPQLMKMSRSCTPWLCVIGGADLQSTASEVGISFGAVQSILTIILGMTKVSTRWVPQMLTNDQKRTPLDISRYLLSHYEDDPGDFIKRVVTQDETWVHHFDPESKMQSKQWKHPASPSLKKFKRVHSVGMVIASMFWDSQGVIMIDYLEQGGMINGAYYAGKLRRLRLEIARKRRGKVTRSTLL